MRSAQNLFCSMLQKSNLPFVVGRLFDAGLDLNITDDEGKTAVFYANRNHSMDTLCELICCDAEFKLDEIDGKALLFYAAKQNFGRQYKSYILRTLTSTQLMMKAKLPCFMLTVTIVWMHLPR